jgi:hypothetical protein
MDDIIGTSSAAPRTNRAGFDQPHFGRGKGKNGVPLEMMESQPEPINLFDSTATAPVRFRVTGTQAGWGRGDLLFAIRDSNNKIPVLLQVPDLQFLCREGTEVRIRLAQQQALIGSGGGSGRKRAGMDDDDDTTSTLYRTAKPSHLGNMFGSLEEIRERIDFIGALYGPPSPNMRVGTAMSAYAPVASGVQIAADVYYGRHPIPDMWQSENAILPTQPLYLIIKMVPIEMAPEYVNPTGEMIKIYNRNYDTKRELVPVLIWYTSNDFKPPRAAPYKPSLYKNLLEQPPLRSTSYKEFDPKNKNKFKIKEGKVILIGKSQFYYPPSTVVEVGERNKLRSHTSTELKQRRQLEVFHDPTEIYN